jgi:hypothetical protein
MSGARALVWAAVCVDEVAPTTEAGELRRVANERMGRIVRRSAIVRLPFLLPELIGNVRSRSGKTHDLRVRHSTVADGLLLWVAIPSVSLTLRAGSPGLPAIVFTG